MKRTITTIIVFVILVGTLGVSLNMLFGYNTITYLERYRQTSTGLWFYRYNFTGYIENISNVFNDTTPLTLVLPTRAWDGSGSIASISNNLAVILDYIIVLLNVLLYPLRIGAYTLRLTLSVIGLNMNNTPNNNIKWLVDLINTLIPLQIPYI